MTDVTGVGTPDYDDEKVNNIISAARAVATSTDEVPAPGSAEPLQDALTQASPDDRAAAAKELAGEDDQAALDAMHEGLRALGVEPE